MAINLSEMLATLEARVTFPFVYVRGKRKSELQRDIEQLRELKARKQKYQGYNETFRGPEQLFQDRTGRHLHAHEGISYAQRPAQAWVQCTVWRREYITGVSVSSERSDQLTLIPLLEGMKNHGIKYEDVTADAYYESEENYSCFETCGTTCYIKPQDYERSKTKKFKSNMALRENMAYDAEKDEYTCQAGHKLRAKYVGKQNVSAERF